MTTPANSPTGSTIGVPWADNMTLADLGTNLALDNTTAVALQQAIDTQRFWATPARAVTDATTEVMQVTLTSARMVNQIIFDVAIFPQTIAVDYYDEINATWRPCLQKGSTSSSPIIQTINTSFPLTLPPVTSVTGHVHPQHSFSGHWQTVEFSIIPVTARLFRMRLQRTTAGAPPTNVFGKLVDYSLAIRNFYIGYTIDSFSDVPIHSPVNGAIASNGTFASTTDLLGSTVDFTMTINSASNVLQNENSITNVIWKCEPQPFPWSVINFYVDARDANGAPQVIDRFFLQPLYTGPTVHIYYSNDTITGSFPGTVAPLIYPVAQVFDPDGVGGDVLHSGLAGLGATAFVTIDNQMLSFDPSRAWWVGFNLNFKIAHGDENFDSPIFDCGAFQVFLTPFGVACQTQFGDTLAMTIDPFDPATTVTLMVSYDGVDVLSINAKVGAVTYSQSMPLPVPLTGATVSTLNVGGFLGDQPGINWFDFNDFVLKIDDVPDTDTIADFLDNPEPYVQVADFAINADPRSNNALVRYHPDWVTNSVPSGFVGGEPDHYALMSWSPIARDYTLTKGNYDIPATKAKYFKFEFSNLVPEPYEVYKPITATVKTFSTSMAGVSTASKTFPITPQTTIGAQLAATYMVNSSVTSMFDNGIFAQPGTGAAQLGLTPTQARVIYDNNSRVIVGTAYWAWNFLPVHSGPTVPQFPSVGKHQYETVTVTQSSKIAYFVGLVVVQAFRLDALAADDTMRYVDNFYDMTNIAEDTNWTLVDDHQLTSGSAQYAVLQSQPFSSTRIVTGVQFAAQESDPIQMLQDPDFDDPVHANWTSVGDATLTPGIVVDTTVGNTIQVSRKSLPNNWNAVMAGYPHWHNITDLNLNWAEVQLSAQNPELQGGITSPAIQTPAGGRISVAARIIAPADLTSPLWVQIVDDQTGIVVSEEPVSVKGHQVTEWYTSFTIGDVVTAPWRWSDFFSSIVSQSLVDSFDTTNGRPLPVMDTGQLWSFDLDTHGVPLSESIVANAAEVTTEGQYNYVDSKTPWGTLEFTSSQAGFSQTLADMLLNPTFSGTTTNWSLGNGSTGSTGTHGGLDGQTTFVTVTSTSGTGNTVIQQQITSTFQIGMTYRLSVETLSSVNGKTFALTVQWLNSAGAVISTSTQTGLVASSTAWQSFDAVNLLCPTGTVKANVIIDYGVMSVGTSFSATNVYFAPSTVGADDTNLILNNSFETNVTGWTVTSGSLTRVAGGSPNGGSFSAQVKATSATADTALVASTQIPNIVAATQYQFTADVNPSFTGTMSLQVNWFNSAGTQIGQTLHTFPVTASTWQTLLWNFTPPTGAVSVSLIVDGGTIAINATFNVDNMFYGYRTERMLAGFDPLFLDNAGRLQDHAGAPIGTNVLTTGGTAHSVSATDDVRVDILPTFLVPSGKGDINHSSNPDPVVWPYSLMFYLNGTWVRTVSHDLGARHLLTIKGRLHQAFANWSWKPFPYGNLPGKTIMYLPRLDKGFWLDSMTFTQFQDNDGNVWSASGSWDLSEPIESPAQDNCGPALTVAQSGSTFTVDTGLWYGSMSAYVRNVATGVSGATHGDVLVLDADNGVTLNAAGNIMQGGISWGNMVPGGVKANSMLTVTWARTSTVTTTTRAGANPTTQPDIMVIKVNGAIVGTFANTILQTWRGTHRGLAGDIYDASGGSRPTGLAPYMLDTAFQAFHWAPDASLTPADPTKPTWNDITNYNSITYNQATRGRTLTEPTLRAQVVQFGESQDVWDIDNLSMFCDPVVWSFSNDGGVTFYPAYDIRNNPHGVLAFPTSTVVTQLGRTPGTSLVWRAISYAPDRVISSLVIRPWYAGLLSGITTRVGMGQTGPNLAPHDQIPPLTQDPAFQVWSNPIPQNWWYQFRLIQRAQSAQQAAAQGD